MRLKQLFLLPLLYLFSIQAFAQLVILQYHHISTKTPASTSTTPDVFAQHMQLLEQEKMHIIDLKQALVALQNGETLPEKSVAITFDDAYQSIYENAWPILKEKNWPFTIFVNPDAVDNGGPATISWEALQQMQKGGALIANHSQHHDYLIEQNEKNLADYLDAEINQAEKRIAEKLGVSHKLLAYPYGEFNTQIMQWLKQQGYIALGQQSGAVGPQTNWQAVPRYPAGGIYANPVTLKTKLYTLAFPIAGDQFKEPVLSSENPPKLQISFPQQDFLARQIQCYSGSEGELEHQVDVKDGVVLLQTAAKQAITSGRDRYNCTAPSLTKPGWYYWYSQYWINPKVTPR
ncbi:MAG: polysaccharide deacetylase family protein [Venatoribacter sp.]